MHTPTTPTAYGCLYQLSTYLHVAICMAWLQLATVHALHSTRNLQIAMDCRCEWKSQQPARTGLVQSVIGVRSLTPASATFGHKDLPFWVETLGCHRDTSHLLAGGCCKAGSFTIIQPENDTFRQQPLAFTSLNPFQAFMMRNGDLRIVEASAPVRGQAQHLEACPLCWHTIKLNTGLTSSSVNALSLPSSKLWPIVHGGASRAAAMRDPQTIVFMDAETLHELASCSISNARSGINNADKSIHRWSWSEHGGMLAVAVCTKAACAADGATDLDTDSIGRNSTYSIHIYDTTSGQQLQFLPLLAARPYMAWSASLDILAVDYAIPSQTSDQMEHPELTVPPEAIAIKLLKPPQGSSAQPPQVRDPQIPGSSYCEWTPCGSLLLVAIAADGITKILDPATLTPAFCLQQTRLDRISWAPGPWTLGCSQLQTVSISAYLRHRRGKIVTLQQIDGQWHTQTTSVRLNRQRCDGHISPDAKALVLLPRVSTAYAEDSIFHYNTNNGRERNLRCFAANVQSPASSRPGSWSADVSSDMENSEPPLFASDPAIPELWGHRSASEDMQTPLASQEESSPTTSQVSNPVPAAIAARSRFILSSSDSEGKLADVGSPRCSDGSQSMGTEHEMSGASDHEPLSDSDNEPFFCQGASVSSDPGSEDELTTSNDWSPVTSSGTLSSANSADSRFAKSAGYQPIFAPFPAGWPQLYAVSCSNVPKDRMENFGEPIVCLVDAKVHKVLSIWSDSDMQQAVRQHPGASQLPSRQVAGFRAPSRDDHKTLKWSPSFRQLAVISAENIVILTFGSICS